MNFYSLNSLLDDLDDLYRVPLRERPAALDAVIKKINDSYSKWQFLKDLRSYRFEKALDQFDQLLLKKSIVLLIKQNYKCHWSHRTLELTAYQFGKNHKADIVRWAGLNGGDPSKTMAAAAFFLFPASGLLGAAAGAALVGGVHRIWNYLKVFDLNLSQ